MTPKQELDFQRYDKQCGIGLHTFNLFQILEKNNMILEEFDITTVLDILLNEKFKQSNDKKRRSYIDYDYMECFPNGILEVINENYVDYESVP